MTPAFSGISGAIVDFVIPAPAAANTHPVDFAVDTSIVDSLEIENLTTYPLSKKCRKRRQCFSWQWGG